MRFFREDDNAVVIISDNGGGIDEKIINKVFAPYLTNKGPDKGTGIGLFMAKAILEKHMGSSLKVRTRPKARSSA